MVNSRSFKEYVARTFDNEFWNIEDGFLRENFKALDLELYKVHNAGIPEITDVKVEHVWMDDMQEMKIQFDVAISVVFEIPEVDYHYNYSVEKTIWIMARFRGNLYVCK